MSDRQTQKRKLLALLQSKPLVSLPEIMDLRIACFTKRVSELRRDGHIIICHKETVDGQTRTKYELRGQRELFGSAA